MLQVLEIYILDAETQIIYLGLYIGSYCKIIHKA